MLINSEGNVIRIRIGDISTVGRVTSGVKLINVGNNTTVVSIAKIAEENISVVEEEIEETPGNEASQEDNNINTEEETTQE